MPGAISVGTPSADLGGDCSGSVGNLVQCTLPVSLGVGATWTITVPYDVALAVSSQTITNTATASSDEDPAGVSAADVTAVVGAAATPGGGMPDSATSPVSPRDPLTPDLTRVAVLMLVFTISALLLGRPKRR